MQDTHYNIMKSLKLLHILSVLTQKYTIWDPAKFERVSKLAIQTVLRRSYYPVCCGMVSFYAFCFKALEELPQNSNDDDIDDLSPDVELPIYQQRDNFFT